jgi:hypothetical protein
MNDRATDFIEKLHREFVERHASERPLPVEPATVHFSALPVAAPDSPLFQEWNFYRHEVGNLLAEGNGGRHILIKGERIIGIWDTHDEAAATGYRLFPDQPFLVHQIQERERVLRCGSNHRWRI